MIFIAAHDLELPTSSCMLSLLSVFFSFFDTMRKWKYVRCERVSESHDRVDEMRKWLTTSRIPSLMLKMRWAWWWWCLCGRVTSVWCCLDLDRHTRRRRASPDMMIEDPTLLQNEKNKFRGIHFVRLDDLMAQNAKPLPAHRHKLYASVLIEL